MRIALAAIFQITNTFSLHQTEIHDFAAVSYDGSTPCECDGYEVGHLIDSIKETGAARGDTVLPLMSAISRTSGPLAPNALDALGERLAERIEGNSDLGALILILSGALVDKHGDSADLSFIHAARAALNDQAPLVVLFSAEAHLSEHVLQPVSLALGFDAEDIRSSNEIATRALDTYEETGCRESGAGEPAATGSATVVAGGSEDRDLLLSIPCAHLPASSKQSGRYSTSRCSLASRTPMSPTQAFRRWSRRSMIVARQRAGQNECGAPFGI